MQCVGVRKQNKKKQSGRGRLDVGEGRREGEKGGRGGGGSNATDSVSITSSLSLLSFFPGVFYADAFYIRQLTPSHNA